MPLSTKRQAEATKDTAEALTRTVVALDAGNRFIKWIDASGRIQCIPSYYKKVEDWEDAEASETSIVIEHGGDRYTIGSDAQYQAGSATFEDDKCQLVKLLGLVAIEPKAGQNQVIIEDLRIMLPDSRKADSVSHLKRLEGSITFKRNGVDVYTMVKRVSPIDETKPAYRYALANGLFRFPKKHLGVIDLGGGTGIARLYTPTGTIIRQADCILPGTFALAQRIAAALKPEMDYSPDLGLIMDAIEANEFTYGTTGKPFQAHFEKARQQWLDEIRNKVKTAWASYWSELAEVLIVGGSAPLAQRFEVMTNGRFKVAPNPQTIALRGMLQ
ncbi:ParM/StbA family protein [Oculatella sp. LEGE 06141]|uniref:ParM/StbA family protein n=1 Tax=Oculatella sp. LEGE 06141 TaxID=1828648 RepID=UPI00188213A6|nr:ParM/StbA family protein [Oculatella sp. LEGE 06141]MBE9182410.1 ParM/StbA family protein [Oculatella sp. LEGE 06141]